MGSMRPTGRFLSFSNNIQRTPKQTVPSGFPQSLSGSETDVSTSNENLSREERYVVRHTARVEPQGQENQSQSNNNNNRNSLKDSVSGSNRNSLKDSVSGGNSNRSSLDVSSSSYNTLIIHNQDDSWSSRPTPIREHERTNSEVKHSNTQSSPYHTLKKTEMGKKPSGIPLPKMHKEQTVTASANYIDIGGQRIYTSPPDHGVQEITEIPDDYLNQSSVLKHLAKEVAQSPPPASPRPRAPSKLRDERKGKGSKAKLSKEKLNLSRSQPDLTSVGVRAAPGGSESSGWCSGGEGSLAEPDDAFAAVLDALAGENHALKRQLADACERVAKTDKLEEEVEKVRSAHEELVQSCERRERLERAARVRLQQDCRRLHDLNRALKQQVELLSQGVRAEGDSNSDALRKELQNREMLIAQLISQNKELACAKERQEIEMAAQRATLQEQRTHIDILDTALTNAQANVVRLEDECRHAGGYVERVLGLQRALASLQQAADRRELTERKLRAQLETELQALRSRECACGGAGGAGGAGGRGGAEAELRRALRERDERLLALEGECAKWEQRYLEEAALRQAAVSAASIPKDAKIAALEKTSAESERLMAEARSEKIRHMDELHSAQKKVADLESRVKELESKVAERDAMIKVLQKHTSAASLRNNSSREELVGLSSGASFSSAEGVSGVSGVAGAVGAAAAGRYRHLARRNYSPHADNASGCGFDSSSLRLEEQLAALESRLERPPVPARGLCCFPGLSTVGGRGGRGEEALLLERQGRASQQTRSSSLPPPPSALPRPPRKPSTRNTRYDRLEHRDARKDSDGSGSIASTASRSSPSPYDTVRKLPSVPTSASLPAAESRESLVRPRDSSLPSPSKLAVYAAARRRSAESAKDTNKRTHHYRIQF
ncbi:angiomotin-like protein 2 [Melitaea cinxia]|uniref:angiomotin-like protein 2 n=1 Tax=Melitaea cinxia TaxID=113334 RepID=UPI001E26F450|nr:angiomotin-like protein 2 [Melitaea cinxia]